MSNVWAPTTGATTGALPSGFTVAGELVSDIVKNFGGYLLAGLGMFVAMMPLILVIVIAIYLPLIGAVFAIDVVGEDLAGLLFLGVFSVMMVAVTAVSAAVIAPLQASLMRAVWAYQVRGEPLGFGAAFSTIGENYFQVALAHLALQGAILLGFLFCYLPGFAVLFLCHWVTAAVVIHKRTIGEAFGQSFQHAKENLGWTIGVVLVGLLITVVCSYIPFIGTPLSQVVYAAYTLKIYRAVFGDGDQPRLT